MTRAPEVAYLVPNILSNPFVFYNEAYTKHPVIKIAEHEMYGVFSSSLVKEVLGRVDDFSNGFGDFMIGARKDDPDIKAITDTGYPFVETLLTADPPVHTRFRKLVNRAFSKSRVDGMESNIRSIATRLIDEFVTLGQCDFVQDFAVPFPIEVIAGEIGLAHAPKGAVKRWTNAIADRLGGLIDKEREMECAREIVEFQQAMQVIITERRLKREDDLLSDLVEARVDGERPLDDIELLSIIQQLMAAGNDTSTAALVRGILLLISNPKQDRIARDNPALIPNMVEEMLRTESPGQSIFRVAKRAVTLGDVEIPAGAMLMVVVGAANRDPGAFESPEKFDVKRENPHAHLAFGRGIHACIGNGLARRELIVAFQSIFERMENIRIVDGTDITLTPHMVAPTLSSLPLAFDLCRTSKT